MTAGVSVWVAVMDRARQGRDRAQCECTGQCGKHAGARCPRTHGERPRRLGPIQLVAAPADVALHGTLAAFTLGVEKLLAWCPSCHDGARRTGLKTSVDRIVERPAGRSEHAAEPVQETLF